jgi:hypothetical protein
MPLPLQLSPFDTALSRAEDATGSDSAGREGSAAGRALITIKRHSSDAAAWPKAERCFRRSSCDGPGSYNPGEFDTCCTFEHRMHRLFLDKGASVKGLLLLHGLVAEHMN